jgi:hypothetical protein
VKINKKAAGAAIVGITLACLGLSAFRFVGSLNQYCGVYANDNRKEVLYRLGFPPTVVGPPEKVDFGMASPVYATDTTDPKLKMPDGKKVNDFPQWTYSPSDDVSIDVAFTPTDAIESITCMTGHAGGCPNLAGVAFGDTEEDVVRKLGKHHASFMLTGVSKRMRFDDLGVEIFLTKNRVYRMSLLGQRPPVTATVFDYLWNLPRRLMP